MDSGSIEILYVPPANHIAGEQKEDVTLSDAWIVDQPVVIPAGKVLKIEPGTVVLLKQGRLDRRRRPTSGRGH